MCAKCIDLVKSHYPECPDSEIGDFLMSATCFPLGSADDIDRQLREHRAAGCVTVAQAVARADAQMEAAMREATR